MKVADIEPVLVEKTNGQEIIRLDKVDPEAEPDPGRPILGWVSTDRVGTWVNKIRGLDMPFFPGIHERDYNPNNMILYDGNQIIGWVREKVLDEVENFLWDYLKGTVQLEKKKEGPLSGFGSETKKIMEEKNKGQKQMSLF